MTQNLLYKRTIPITDKISLHVPTVGEVLDDEDGYYGAVHLLTAMPVDLMVQLDDLGIDFTTLNEYSLFLMIFPSLRNVDTHLIFGDLDLSGFALAENEKTGMVVLLDREHDTVIDRVVQGKIAHMLRQIHHMEKNRRKPANEEAKRYMLDRARKKLQRQQRQQTPSQLEGLITAMVNAEQFKYGYESVKDLTIYQFNESVRQIIHKVDYDNRMIGVYTGNINAKELSRKDLNWLLRS